MPKPGTLSNLSSVTMAPYIQKATALIGIPRKVGGNMFRHQMATMSNLIDYKYDDAILLKASVVHDLLEDLPEGGTHDLESVDEDGPAVLEVVKELTIIYSSDDLSDKKRKLEKEAHLIHIMTRGSNRSRLIKLADRISNVTDISTDIQNTRWIKEYIKQTEKCILKYAQDFQPDMWRELVDAINKKKEMISILNFFTKRIKTMIPKNGTFKRRRK